MNPSEPMSDVVVVGAGLSGLLAAGTLQNLGFKVRVLDKSRGVGGRLATRRVDGRPADHGAQFFTAYDPVFRQKVESWLQAGVIRQWSTGFAIPDGTFKDNGVPRYCGVSGMTSLAKHLAQGLDVRLHSRAVNLTSQGHSWTVTTEDGTVHSSRALLLTPPVPQTLNLLATGKIPLPFPIRDTLEGMDYAPCLTLLVRLAGPSLIPEPGGIWMKGEPLLWMADNQRKGIASEGGALVTIHAGQDFSRENLESPELHVTATMSEAATPWLGSPIEHAQLHRWRYSIPLRVHPEPCLLVPDPAPLAFAGDAFGGPRVEAAALSGLAAAASLAQRLGRT